MKEFDNVYRLPLEHVTFKHVEGLARHAQVYYFVAQNNDIKRVDHDITFVDDVTGEVMWRCSYIETQLGRKVFLDIPKADMYEIATVSEAGGLDAKFHELLNDEPEQA